MHFNGSAKRVTRSIFLAGAKRDLLDVVKVDVLCDGLPPEAEERQTQAVREEAAAAGKVLALSSPLPEEEKELSQFHLDLPKIPQSGMSEIATVPLTLPSVGHTLFLLPRSSP